jgi:hypothetical protein
MLTIFFFSLLLTLVLHFCIYIYIRRVPVIGYVLLKELKNENKALIETYYDAQKLTYLESLKLFFDFRFENVIMDNIKSYKPNSFLESTINNKEIKKFIKLVSFFILFKYLTFSFLLLIMVFILPSLLQ